MPRVTPGAKEIGNYSVAVAITIEGSVSVRVSVSVSVRVYPDRKRNRNPHPPTCLGSTSNDLTFNCQKIEQRGSSVEKVRRG